MSAVQIGHGIVRAAILGEHSETVRHEATIASVGPQGRKIATKRSIFADEP